MKNFIQKPLTATPQSTLLPGIPVQVQPASKSGQTISQEISEPLDTGSLDVSKYFRLWFADYVERTIGAARDELAHAQAGLSAMLPAVAVAWDDGYMASVGAPLPHVGRDFLGLAILREEAAQTLAQLEPLLAGLDAGILNYQDRAVRGWFERFLDAEARDAWQIAGLIGE